MNEGNVTPLFSRGRKRDDVERVVADQDRILMEGAEPAEGASASPDRLPIRITRLEMRHPPARGVPMPHGQRLGLLRLREVPTSFYRFLFDGVGAEHHWRIPADQTEDQLHDWLNSDACEVHVLYVGGAPAGFFELDLSKRGEAVVLSCFGIMPHARGRGLARWFLSEAIKAAWAHDPPRVRLQTNNHDSPIALRLYQALGFEVVGTTQGYLMLRDTPPA